ncbi:flagellin-like hook-associated protein FlgL [Tepidamorphus gemmatus]|uniref:Flagellin n=1 Tax=Tepidamorphus gemmatus TaxID=747076 RepID=A0A4R3M1D7_9HYPH|nr:flagellin [Tepidamorphus gemmatus]TCT06466.1 flagellin-like hook-associated protein FlgL [Tepidamorphus gemmatus]
MSDITLSAGVRQNLLSLQKTADLMATTQNRLATGKKVNSALDNPTNFFTSASLQARSKDLSSLLDSMSNGIKTLEAADNGLTAITKTLESMQSTLRQARQDKSFKTESFAVNLGASPTGTETLSFTGGAVGTTAVGVDLTTSTATLAGGAFTAVDFTNGGANDGSISFDISANGGATQTITIAYSDVNGVAADASAVTAEELASIINTKLTAANVDASATVNGSGQIDIASNRTDSSDASLTISNFAVANGASGSGLANGSGTVGNVEAKTVDQLVTSINNSNALKGKIRASNDNGKLRIENQSTQDLTVTGVNATSGQIDGSTGTSSIVGNSVRADLAAQFNELRDQLDKLSDDASFNGINLLRGDKLTLTFNETGTSTIEIQTKGGETINSAYLGLTNIEEADLDADTNIDSLLATVGTALGTIRSQASAFGSNLSIVQNRTEFTKSMMNTLQTGADALVLADSNEEAANMLALQTRQQLSSTALSLASQADQAVLRLF